MNLIELQHISKQYGSTEHPVYALRDVSLSVAIGEFVAIMGKSGCGKTTLLNIIGTVSKATGGDYYFRGEEITRLSLKQAARFRNENIGFVLQNYSLIPDMNIYQNIALPLRYHGDSSRQIDTRVSELAEKLGIEDKLYQYPYELSGGQCQRVAIARALASAPSLLLADEPTGALDETTGHTILSLMQEVNRQGTTIVLVTHDLEVARISQRILTMRNGCFE